MFAKNKTNFRDRIRHNLGNSTSAPLKTHTYGINMYEKIHQNTKRLPRMILLYLYVVHPFFAAICQDSNVLMIFDGYITPEKLPLRYCSQLKHEATSRRQFLSKTDRLVIRWVTIQIFTFSIPYHNIVTLILTIVVQCSDIEEI